MATLSDKELELRATLATDYEPYAKACLVIRPKDPKSGNVPFVLNRAQRYVHRRLEEQRAKIGKVRALVLKGRQQGISTYIGGRFYWRTSHNRGVRCYILTHEQDATNNLFAMVERYHAHCPEQFKPSTGAANAKELAFDRLESGYAVGTAGTKAVGRSQTIQYLHGSEVAFWPNAATHFAGVVQAVPDMPGTEIILESTANGVGGEYHERWQQAEAGVGDYIAVFVPWFWQEEYTRPVPDDFVLDEEERTYRDSYQLTLEQMAWRRAKIAELKNPTLFKQEYPATAAEAFQMSGHDSFIATEDVLRARKTQIDKPTGAKVWGYDPNWGGTDRAALAKRQGRKVYEVTTRAGRTAHSEAKHVLPYLPPMQQVGWLRKLMDDEKPARLFIDVGGGGIWLHDQLVDQGYGHIVRAVNFGGSPVKPPPLDDEGKPKGGYLNRRAEMWGDSRDWLQDVGGASIPDRDSLHSDACAPGFKYDSITRIQLESKEEMKRRGIRSPDEWDAVALTFAEPVADHHSGPRRKIKIGMVA